MPIALLQQPYEDYNGRTATTGGQVIYKIGKRSIVRSLGVQPAAVSVTQASIREATKAASEGYRSINPAHVAGWRDLARRMIRYDRLGKRVQLSPWDAFIMVNVYRQMAGEAIDPVAPPYARPIAPAPSSIQRDDFVSVRIKTATNFNYDGFVLIEQSPSWSSKTREANVRECTRNRSDPGTQTCIYNVNAGSTSGFNDDANDMLNGWPIGNRAGVKFTPLSPGYVPGPWVLKTLEIVHEP